MGSGDPNIALRENKNTLPKNWRWPFVTWNNFRDMRRGHWLQFQIQCVKFACIPLFESVHIVISVKRGVLQFSFIDVYNPRRAGETRLNTPLRFFFADISKRRRRIRFRPLIRELSTMFINKNTLHRSYLQYSPRRAGGMDTPSGFWHTFLYLFSANVVKISDPAHWKSGQQATSSDFT